MGRKGKIAIIVGATLLIAVAIYFLFPRNGQNKKLKEPEYNKELKDQVANSEGTYILYNLMKDYENVVSLKTIADPLDESLRVYKTGYPTVYFLIDKELSLSQDAVDTIYNFVSNGGHAFISSGDLNRNFYDYFFERYPLKTYRDTVFPINFFHPDLKLDQSYPIKIVEKQEVKKHRWKYYDAQLSYYREDVVEIGTTTKWDRPIFIKFPVGKGWFYLHSVPEAFYNASMFDSVGVMYAESALSNLPKGHYLWHEHNRKWDYLKDFDKKRRKNEVNRDKKNTMQYILNNRSLRWAYLLILGSVFLYVVFASKRKQRIIPTVEPNTNESLSFVNTVSQLYLKQGRHDKFIKHYQRSFLNFIKDKYFIPYTKKLDENYIQLVARKSEISPDKIREILIEFRDAQSNSEYPTSSLIALHKKVEEFYKNCK